MLALVKDGVVHFIPLQAVHFKLIRTVQIILIYPVHLKVIWAVHLNRCNHKIKPDDSNRKEWRLIVNKTVSLHSWYSCTNPCRGASAKADGALIR